MGPSEHGGRRRRGGLEDEVVAVVAASSEPLTVAEVRDRLDADLAYTTVMTTLARLSDKAVLQRTPRGRAFAYRLADPAAAAAQQMHAVLEGTARSGGDRSAVLARFVGDLDPSDVPVLEALLRELDGG